MALSVNARAQQTVTIELDGKSRAQTIHNFGAAGCWFSENIGKYWAVKKKERMAELLFSKEMDTQGNPKGIGLSAWRFNIGGGTAEQGDGSGIKDANKRVESFQNPDGSYDWTKQPGARWFLSKAKSYGIETLIAFANTPPVHFTRNGLGFRTEKGFRTNLKPAKFDAYADFLAAVVKHFQEEGVYFDYISPVNEPQWSWAGKIGQAKQEGTSWTNEEIYKVVKALSRSLEENKLSTQILISEAGKLTFLYDERSHASRQIQQFYDKGSYLYLANTKHLPPIVAGHSYFTDEGDSAIISIRRHVADTARKYGVDYWQSEYSLLSNGFREGSDEKRTSMDCGLFLAKIIHHDLTVGNATAWQFWNAFEPGDANLNTRFYLIALQPENGFRDGNFVESKNLWALGHFSRFIRPGMHRLTIDRSDKLTNVEAAQKLMVSAFADKRGRSVLVAINYEKREQKLQLRLKNLTHCKTFRRFVTTASPNENMKAFPVQQIGKAAVLPPRSITTIIID